MSTEQNTQRPNARERVDQEFKDSIALIPEFEQPPPETGAVDVGAIAKHICNSFRKWEMSGAGSHVHVYEALKPLTARIAELEQKKEHAVGIPAFPQSITEAAKRHQQQPEQMEALIQRVKELGQECSRIQSEYDEFKRAALTLTTINSIENAMKMKP